MTETALVARLKAGEEAAYREVVTTYGPRMLATTRRILDGDTAAAEDCVQEAFLSAFRALPRFEGRSRLGTWLHRIAINAALQRRRATGQALENIDDLLPRFDRFGHRLAPEAPVVGPERDPHTLLDAARRKQLIRDKINQLPEDYRMVLVLRDLEDRPTAEVAALLEVSEGTVKMRLHRARAALRTLVAPVLAVEDEA